MNKLILARARVKGPAWSSPVFSSLTTFGMEGFFESYLSIEIIPQHVRVGMDGSYLSMFP